MTRFNRSLAGPAIIMAAFVTIMAGCEKEESQQLASASRIPIRISVNAAGSTKSEAMTTPKLEASEGFALDVWTDDSWYYYDDDGKRIGDEQPAGQYINSNGKVNVVYSSAHHHDTGRSDDMVTDGWYISDDSGIETYNWITSVRMRFWAMYPKNADVDSETEGIRVITTSPTSGSDEMEFEYTLPKHKDGYDATNQKDLLFAYNDVVKTNKNGSNMLSADEDNIDLTFNHPLSEIRFCVSPDDGTFDTGLKIKSIGIWYIPKSGTCVFHGNGKIKPGEGETPMFEWVPSTDLERYSQQYNVMFDTKPSGWTASEYGSEGKQLYTCENAFRVIPHKTSEYAMIVINISDDILGERQIQVQFNNGFPDCDVWKPGHYYTYKINATTIGREIAASVSLFDWTDRQSTIPIM